MVFSQSEMVSLSPRHFIVNYHSQRPVRIRRPPRGKKKKSTSSLCIESIGSVIFRRISNGIKSGKEKKLKHLAYIPDITDRCN